MKDMSFENLSKFLFFYDLSKEKLNVLKNFLQVIERTPSRYVFKEGDEPSGMYFIIEGRVKVVKKTKSGKEVVLKELESPDFFGEMAFIDGRRRAGGVVTLTDFKAYFLSRANYDILIQYHPDIAVNMIRKIAHITAIKLRKASNDQEGVV